MVTAVSSCGDKRILFNSTLLYHYFYFKEHTTITQLEACCFHLHYFLKTHENTKKSMVDYGRVSVYKRWLTIIGGFFCHFNVFLLCL